MEPNETAVTGVLLVGFFIVVSIAILITKDAVVSLLKRLKGSKVKLKGLKVNKNLVYILLVIGLLFWWFQLRPAHIRSSCVKQARIEVKEFVRKQADFGDLYYQNLRNRGVVSTEVYDILYERCLKSNGINK